MKSFILLLALLFFASCFGSKSAVQESPAAAPSFVTWDTQMHELGTVKKGEKREMQYEFTNTSGENIQIDIVDACECTTIEFPRGVIAPGEKGIIQAVFDSSEKEESETITIRVIYTNTTADGFPRIEKLEYHFELEV
jgi:peptidoglycan-associated lipoprotein